MHAMNQRNQQNGHKKIEKMKNYVNVKGLLYRLCTMTSREA